MLIMNVGHGDSQVDDEGSRNQAVAFVDAQAILWLANEVECSSYEERLCKVKTYESNAREDGKQKRPSERLEH